MISAGALMIKPKTTARVRLFCLPSAGVGASIYRSWHEAFPPEVQVAVIQLPGRENRFSEPHFERMQDVVDECLMGMRNYLDLPFAILGHSMGAVVGYELMHRLRAEGLPVPLHFFACSHDAPDLVRDTRPLSTLTDEALVNYLDTVGGIDPEFLKERSYLDLMLPLIRADLRVLDKYEWHDRGPCDVPITAIVGREDTWAAVDKIRMWGRQTSSQFKAITIDGGHFLVRDNSAEIMAWVMLDLMISMSSTKSNQL